MTKVTSDEQLAEFIADHLPISSETARHFVDAAQKGYMFDTVDHAIALSIRDKRIEELTDDYITICERIHGK